MTNLCHSAFAYKNTTEGDDKMTLLDAWRNRNTLGGVQARASKKLNHGSGFETFDQLKEILTDPDVQTTFNSLNTKSQGSYTAWVARIIQNCAYKIPAEETIPLAKFLVDNTVAKKIVQLCTENHDGVLRSTLSTLNVALETIVEDTPPKQRGEIADVLAKDGFGRAVIGKTNPHYYITPFSEGLLPQEFNSLLTTTQLFADVPQNEYTECEIRNKTLANEIALNIFWDDHPELKNNESLNLDSLSTIEGIDMDEPEKRKYKKRAWEYLEIAFKHCKGAPEKTLDNKHEL